MWRYFDAMQATLERHGGTVEKFIGDAVVAVFGVPAVHEDDALRAVRAAFEMREALDRVNEELEREYGVRPRDAYRRQHGRGRRRGRRRGSEARDRRRGQRRGATRAGGRAGRGAHRRRRPTRRRGRRRRRAGRAGRGEGEEPSRWRRGGSSAVRPDVPAFTRAVATPFVGRGRRARRAPSGVRHDGARRVVPARHDRRDARDRQVPPRPRSRRARRKARRGSWSAAARLRRGDHLPPARRHRARHRRGRPEPALAELLANVERGAVATRLDRWARSVRRRARDRRRRRRGRSGALLETLAALAAARRGRGRHPLGRAGAARPARVRPRLLERRADPAPLSRAPRPLRRAAVMGRSAAADDARLACPLDDAESADLSTGSSTSATSPARSAIGSSRRRRATHCSSSRCSRCSPTIPTLRTTPCRRRSRRSSPPASTGSSPLSGRCSSAPRSRGGCSTAARSRSCSAAGRRPASAALLALTRKECCGPTGRSFEGDDGFRFNHVLIRDVAYASMPKELRADLHTRLASWLEAHAGAKLTGHDEIVGYHLEQAYLIRVELGGRRRARVRSRCEGGRLLGRGRAARARPRRVRGGGGATRARLPAPRGRACGARVRCSPTSAGRFAARGALDAADAPSPRRSRRRGATATR